MDALAIIALLALLAATSTRWGHDSRDSTVVWRTEVRTAKGE